MDKVIDLLVKTDNITVLDFFIRGFGAEIPKDHEKRPQRELGTNDVFIVRCYRHPDILKSAIEQASFGKIVEERDAPPSNWYPEE